MTISALRGFKLATGLGLANGLGFARRWALALVVCVLAVSSGAESRAADEQVTLQHQGLTLNGRLLVADGKTLADNGAVLLTHGTLAHNGMELIETMQTALAERGLNSLALTLSLGLDARTGMYDCAVPHRHKHEDALDEIGLWLDWLKAQGASEITLMGHSRGGNQTAWFAAERMDPAIKTVALLAPATSDRQKEVTAFESRFGTPLQPILDKASALVAAGKGDTMMEVPGLLYCEAPEVSAATFASYYEVEPRKHTPALLPKIGVPVLVIAGSEDDVVADLPEAVEPIANGETIMLTVIDGADHFFLDFFAEDAADAVDELISSR
jgi:pimeloyl-ACP methyl ester carboxylesterase